MGLKVMSISSLPVFATPTLGSRSEFSTLLEATEAVAMYVYASCL